MRCLWLTLADPTPQHNGQFVYSGGLISAMAAAGAEVDVLGLRRPGSTQPCGEREDGIRWWLAGHEPRSHWASLFSPLPHIADRCRIPAMSRMLAQLLEQNCWDSIVFDGLSVGWALRPVQKYLARGPGRPKLVYVAHNHEESVRAQIATHQPNGPRRQAIWLDAKKTALLERNLVDVVDLVTAITPEDCARFRERRMDKKLDVLTPGYGGRQVPDRKITTKLPRRAVIVGSFDWIAKRMNLEEFVKIADPLFAVQNAELQVIGSANEAFLAHLRKSHIATQFTGTVESVTRYMDDARVAIVPERSGGGFKLKVLDYVFNRLPIFALEGSVAGVPLEHNESILNFPDLASLAQGVLAAMDDVDLLNRLQNNAYEKCRSRFQWMGRGEQLLSAIAAR